MTEIRKQDETVMRERFMKARRSGELPKDVNVDDYTMESANGAFFALLAIRKINNLRAVNTLNSSTTVASTSIYIVFSNTYKHFAPVPARLSQLV
jgi:hypothetical protein